MRHLFFLFLLIAAPLFSEPVPRTVALLYDGTEYGELWYTSVHQYLATPLEHLGTRVRYYDVSEGWPDIRNDPEVIGAAVWNLPVVKGEERNRAYLEWAVGMAEAGKRLVFFELPDWEQYAYDETVKEKIERLWSHLGVKKSGRWVEATYTVRFVYEDPNIVGFERKYVGIRPGYPAIKIISDKTAPHLIAREKEDAATDSVLIASGPGGGFVVDDYAMYVRHEGEKEFRRWYINPFAFLKRAFGLDKLPKPDVTTLSGRRLFYSHIDGDGWNSLSEIEEYRRRNTISAEVVAREILLPHPELPVTVAPIAADLDQEWIGLKVSQTVAEGIFFLDHIEPASHTYSHPFDWGFFRDYLPKDEKPYLAKYPYGSWEDKGIWENFIALIRKEDGERAEEAEQEFHYPKKLREGYTVPRAFANFPFDIHQEITGSLAFINRFAPEGKKAALLQWSGNCQPFLKALQLVEEAGVCNLNGGDTRFDSEFGSYAWVRPLYRPVGNYLQVYASMSNENTYTDLWSSRFYAYRRLPYTLHNTEVPIRLRPINLYYHMYSGEKLASLNALRQNIAYIEKQKIAPVRASRFSETVLGFYSLTLDRKGEDIWEVQKRGALQTLRFDDATLKSVDLARSEGVVGFNHLHGSLYVFLDPAVEPATVALKEELRYWEEPVAAEPYLLEGRWALSHLKREEKGGWSFTAQGFGDGEMRWRVPEDGAYEVRAGVERLKVDAVGNLLEIVPETDALEPIEVAVRKQ